MLAALKQQSGLTLLEVLIALSIFALIGVASYRVLTTVSTTQRMGEQHSIQLGAMQKALTLIDADLQQLATRDIRTVANAKVRYLQINEGDYPIELTRAGWANPLMLSRSSLQRVAYDTGPHPDAGNARSRHYQDKSSYLRRHYWPVLDRTEQTQPVTQILLAQIERLSVTVITDSGRYRQWPVNGENKQKIAIKGIELRLEHTALGELTRLYKVF